MSITGRHSRRALRHCCRRATPARSTIFMEGGALENEAWGAAAEGLHGLYRVLYNIGIPSTMSCCFRGWVRAIPRVQLFLRRVANPALGVIFVHQPLLDVPERRTKRSVPSWWVY